MLGAIAGDIIGSTRENFSAKSKDFTLFLPTSFFTDDTVLTIAVAEALFSGRSYASCLKEYARRYFFRGYGPRFYLWMLSPMSRPYGSCGNGSAMRVSPVAWAFNTEEEVLAAARASAECTHNHPEGIKGAQAVALAIFLARQGETKDTIRRRVAHNFDYDLSRTIDEIRPDYRTDLTCRGSVPQAITAFLDSTDFEDAIRNAVSLGGDADTMAAIAGAIAEAYYREIPAFIADQVKRRLTRHLLTKVLDFYARKGNGGELKGIKRL